MKLFHALPSRTEIAATAATTFAATPGTTTRIRIVAATLFSAPP